MDPRERGDRFDAHDVLGVLVAELAFDAQAQGRADAPETLGLEVARSLLAQGARALIDATDPG